MAAVGAFRLKRNGLVILTWYPPHSGASLGSPGIVPAGTATRTVLDQPGGPVVYTLEVLMYDPNTGGSFNEIRHRSVLVQGVKI